MTRHIRSVIILLLTVGLMAFFLRNANLSRVWSEVLSARWDLLLAGVVLTLVAYLLRVERWRHLLYPIGNPKFGSALRATVIGFAANALLPGRVGEVVRPLVLARRERLSATATFATIVVERLLDLLAVCLIVAGFVTLSGFETSAASGELLETLETAAVVAGGLAVATLGGVFLLAANPARAGRVVHRWAIRAPGGLVRPLTSFAERFLEGLAVTRQARPLGVALAWSVPLWTATALSIWCVTEAFGIHVPLSGATILMALIVVGVAVPTPGGVGGYHAAYQLGATVLYGATDDRAVGAALVMHLVSFGPITLLGLVFMAQDGLRLRGIRDLAPSDGSSREPVDSENRSTS